MKYGTMQCLNICHSLRSPLWRSCEIRDYAATLKLVRFGKLLWRSCEIRDYAALVSVNTVCIKLWRSCEIRDYAAMKMVLLSVGVLWRSCEIRDYAAFCVGKQNKVLVIELYGKTANVEKVNMNEIINSFKF